MELKQKLSEIQQKMKAPKNLRNDFGKYNYRNAEGILEAFKPFEEQYKTCLLITDEIIEVGGRVYVRALVTLKDVESEDEIQVVAYAREAGQKTGMDDAQVTGAASSYARKYALNGLFLLDDTKDPDTNEYQKQTTVKENYTNTNKKRGTSSVGTESKDDIVRIEAKRATITNICKKHRVSPVTVCAKNDMDWLNLTESELDVMLKSLANRYGDN